jgi:hypothetical protein
MSNQYGPQIVTNGLVLCLDAGNNKSYPGSGTAWNDLSGNNNGVTLINGPSYNSSNRGSIVFDGVNDHGVVSIPSLSNQQFSGDFFLYPIATSGLDDLETVICKFHALNQWNFRLSIGNFALANRVLVISVRDRSNNTTTVLGPDLNLNQWYHIAFSIQELGTIKLYLNGVLYGESAAMTFSMPPNITNNVYICSSDISIDGSRFYGGMRIANIKIYNSILTSKQVEKNYNATKGRFGL